MYHTSTVLTPAERAAVTQRNALVEANLGLPFLIVRKMAKDRNNAIRVLGEDAALSLGNEALMRCAEPGMYKPHLGKFSTYACRAIWTRIIQASSRVRPFVSFSAQTHQGPVAPPEPNVMEDEEEAELLHRRLEEAKDAVLDERERTILDMRFLEGQTLAQAGAQFGLSKERARLVQGAALRKMAVAMGAPPRPKRVQVKKPRASLLRALEK